MYQKSLKHCYKICVLCVPCYRASGLFVVCSVIILYLKLNLRKRSSFVLLRFLESVGRKRIPF